MFILILTMFSSIYHTYSYTSIIIIGINNLLFYETLHDYHVRHVSSDTLRLVTPSLPLLRTSSDTLCHVTPSLPILRMSFYPFLTHLHSHLFLTSTATSNGSTRVASASKRNICTTNHDGCPTKTSIPFPNTLIYQ